MACYSRCSLLICFTFLCLLSLSAITAGQIQDVAVDNRGTGKAAIADTSDEPEEKAEEKVSIGSLPPMNPIRSEPKEDLPSEILPSAVNVVTHEAQFAEDNPALRPQCLRIIRMVQNGGSQKNRSSKAFAAYVTMARVLSQPYNATNSEGEYKKDKTIRYALQVLSTSAAVGMRQLDWHYHSSLRNCAVGQLGRTMFMEMIQRGYIQSLSSDIRKLFTGPLGKLKDTENNNIVHLAVMSKNSQVVEVVLALMGSEDIKLALDERNMAGNRALDISNANITEDITDQLKKAYQISDISNMPDMDDENLEFMADVKPHIQSTAPGMPDVKPQIQPTQPEAPVKRQLG